MNETSTTPSGGLFKKILTEPRHFFFWLALVGLLGIAGSLSLAVLSDHKLPGTHWLCLAGVLGFLIGSPCFVLAWIPPLRRLMARLLRFKLIIAAALVTLIALFYAVENWRGRQAWQSFVRLCESEGIYFSVEKIVPPQVPADENMFEALPWTEIKLVQTNGQFRPMRSDEWFPIGGTNNLPTPDAANLQVGRRDNLKEWQDFYRYTNSFPTASGGRTNYFQLPATASASPAQDVLLALDTFAPRLQQVRDAARRPSARFGINYEDGFSALLPHLSYVKGVSQYLRLRSSALLAEGDNAAALADILLALRVGDAINDEPLLISQLVRIACLQITLNNVRDGVADHKWNDAQLAVLDQALAKANLLVGFQSGMDGERFFEAWSIDYVQKERNWQMFEDTSEGNVKSSDLWQAVNDAIGRMAMRLTPTGWFNQNKVSLGRMQRDLIRPSVDVQKQLVLPELSRRADAAMFDWRPTPYNLFAGMLMPALGRAAQKTALVQTYLNEARIAIALERHRLANGRLPESLEVLMPRLLAQVPHDVINGQPLKYRRTDDGNYLLYSVGWNEKDDGGNVALTKSGKTLDIQKGDWVWQSSAK